MKYKFNKKLSFTSLLAIAIVLVFTNCERDISDDAVLATYPKTANIFTDVPVGLTDAFFESFDPAGGANPTGFGTDNEVAEKLGLTRNYVSVTFGRIKERTGLNRSQVCYIFGLRESQRKHEMHKV